MKIVTLINAVAFLVVACDTVKAKKDSVILTVIYDSYSPYSIQFIQQLYKTWKEFKNNIRLELIPFGLGEQVALSDGHYEFKCTQGDKECEANALHACAIDEACRESDGSVPTLDCPPRVLGKALAYINCLVQQKKQNFAHRECAVSSELSPADIEDCAAGSAGEVLLSRYYSYTRALEDPPVTFVPFIMVNGKYSIEIQYKAGKNLRGLICEYLPGQC